MVAVLVTVPSVIVTVKADVAAAVKVVVPVIVNPVVISLATIILSAVTELMVMVLVVFAAPFCTACGFRTICWAILPAESVAVEVGATLIMTLPEFPLTRFVPLGVVTDQLPLALVVVVPVHTVVVSPLSLMVTVKPVFANSLPPDMVA